MQSFQLGRYSIVWLTFRCYSDEDDQWRSTAPNLKALASVFTEKTTMLQTSPRPIQTSSSSGFVHVNFRFDSHVLDCTVLLWIRPRTSDQSDGSRQFARSESRLISVLYLSMYQHTQQVYEARLYVCTRRLTDNGERTDTRSCLLKQGRQPAARS